jgi:hypothetical protein
VRKVEGSFGVEEAGCWSLDTGFTWYSVDFINRKRTTDSAIVADGYDGRE